MKILAAIDDAGLSVKEQIGQLSGLTPVLDKALAIIGPDGDVAEIKEDLTRVQTGNCVVEGFNSCWLERDLQLLVIAVGCCWS